MNMEWATRYKQRYDQQYYETGKTDGVSWYDNYQWEPERSHAEAFAFVETMRLDHAYQGRPRAVDFGCAKGFFVRAMVENGYEAFGIDISDYAREHGDPLVRDRLFSPDSNPHLYDCGFSKDTLEHVAYADIENVLAYLASICPRWLLIVPLADHDGEGVGVFGDHYRIPEYELETTHIIREGERWWLAMVERFFHVNMAAHWLQGCKDKWFRQCPTGNLVLRTEALC